MTGLRRLCRDSDGVTAVEFALLAPVFLMGLMGAFDMGHNMYTRTMLVGAIQKTARESTIEGAASSQAALDRRITEVVYAIAPGADIDFERQSYTNFSEVGQSEDYTDVDDSGTCDNGEPFEDANGNGAWDADRGTAGFGGARDAVLYTVTVTYPRLFPFAGLVGQSPDMSISAETVLRNQPFGLQGEQVATAGTCA